ncbi:MAG: radical SAM protein [Anaerolineae bacterium]|nr:radical SAM protein [Anaerolineae bacterium]
MDCPHIPQLGYGEFSSVLHERADGQRIPLIGSLELTFRCNLRCHHCYLSGLHAIPSGQRELTFAEYRNLFDQLADEGTFWLLLTGGEPLVRSDFVDIYTYAKRKGFLLTLFTNATLLTPELVDFLADWRPFVVEVTLYGMTPETYERVTGVSGFFHRCIRGIEQLLDRGVRVKLKTMVLSENKHELPDMEAFAESLGVEFRFDALINAGIYGDKAPTALRLLPEEVAALDMSNPERVAAWQEFIAEYRHLDTHTDTLYTCGAGVDSFHIDPYGQLSICMTSRAEQYDLRTGTFREGWRQFLKAVRYQPAPEQSICRECPLRFMCDQCPGWAIMEHGDPGAPVDYLCRITHLRAARLGVQSVLDQVR